MLQHGLGDCTRLAGVPVGRLARHHLDLGMLRQHAVDALDLIIADAAGQHALDDGNLMRGLSARAALLHHHFGDLLAHADEVGTDEGIRLHRALHVELDDDDARGVRLLQQARERLQVGVLRHDDVRMLGDERRHSLRHRIGVPVGILRLELHAVMFGLDLDDAAPGLGEVEADRDRQIGDGLAL